MKCSIIFLAFILQSHVSWQKVRARGVADINGNLMTKNDIGTDNNKEGEDFFHSKQTHDEDDAVTENQNTLDELDENEGELSKLDENEDRLSKLDENKGKLDGAYNGFPYKQSDELKTNKRSDKVIVKDTGKKVFGLRGDIYDKEQASNEQDDGGDGYNGTVADKNYRLEKTILEDDKLDTTEMDYSNAKRSTTCNDKTTPWNDEGRGRSHYLDRHLLKCNENQGLNRFRLVRNGQGQYRYVYRCCDLGVPCSEKNTKNTPPNADGAGNMIYLDRHEITCGNDNFITSFRLIRPTSTQISYRFDCCQVTRDKKCYNTQTPFNADGGGNTVYLDRHNVECNTGYSMTYIRLLRNGPPHDKVHYSFRCCEIEKPVTNVNETFSHCIQERKNADCANIRYSPFRSITGICNNLLKPTWGAAQTRLRRITAASYVDGITVPNGFPGTKTLPTAAQVSQAIFNVEKTNNGNKHKLAVLFMTFGQFLDHDMTEVPIARCAQKVFGQCKNIKESFKYPCLPIYDDPSKYQCTNFARSEPICPADKNNPGVRQHPNEVTAFIDASQVYGASETLSKSLRVLNDESGELKVNNANDNLLPVVAIPKGFSPCSFIKDVQGERTTTCKTLGGCSLVGDFRGDENIALHSMHTLWVREHNRIARQLKKLNPSWKGEQIFQTARKIVGALWQKSVYDEYVPQLACLNNYSAYDPSINPSIIHSFASAAFRYGHSLVPNSFQQNDKNFDPTMNPVPLRESFFNRQSINFYGIEPTMFGLIGNQSNEVDNSFAEAIARHLFARPGEHFTHDLLALNIQRGRDHGTPSYGTFREVCGLSKLKTWSDLNGIMLPETISRFQKVYKDPNEIDLFAAGVSEIHVKDLELGPTFGCLIGKQFKNTRDGDRLFFRNPGVFTTDQLNSIEATTLSSVLCENLKGIVSIQPKSLLLPNAHSNKRVSCSQIPKLNLSPWKSSQ